MGFSVNDGIRKRNELRKAKYFAFAKYHKFKARLTRTGRYEPVFNVNRVDEVNHKNRALLIYLVKPFLLQVNEPRLMSHQNSRRCKQIAALLGELGYIVDAVDIRDREFLPLKNYDVIISNRADLRGMDAYFKQHAVRIYLASVTNHLVHNTSLRARHERLSRRRGREVQMRRVYSEVMPYAMTSNAIIGIGNNRIIGTWRAIFPGPIYRFNNYGFRETPFLLYGKDFATARNHFLFFASGSQVQKGLDLLLEIFPKLPHLHLHVCSSFEKEPDFCECYRKELHETPNIHAVGRVQVNGPEYDDLVRKCAYVIYPTCSEGQSGSVVQCMYSGLIPLVTREAGIDAEDFGVMFSDDSLEEVENVIVRISQLPEEWHRHRSIRTRQVAEADYSEDAFINRWRHILAEILN